MHTKKDTLHRNTSKKGKQGGGVQPVVQAEFRKGFSCVGYTQTIIERIIEMIREYRLSLVLASVAYENVFDSV